MRKWPVQCKGQNFLVSTVFGVLFLFIFVRLCLLDCFFSFPLHLFIFLWACGVEIGNVQEQLPNWKLPCSVLSGTFIVSLVNPHPSEYGSSGTATPDLSFFLSAQCSQFSAKLSCHPHVIAHYCNKWGDWLARWLECRTGDPKVEGSNPIRSTRKTFSGSKRLCWLAVSVPNPCLYTHAYKRSCTHVKDPVVHVRVR